MKNLVGLWPNVFYALELAKVGNYSVQVLLDEDYKAGFDDYASLKEFCKGWFDNFKSDGDLKVIMNKPFSYNDKKCESLEDISKRIGKTLQLSIPTVLDVSGQQMLDHACNKLELSLSTLEFLKKLSATAARVYWATEIKAEHVCVALNYSINVSSKIRNAEKKSIMFGEGMIEIKYGAILNSDIKDAITYLKGLI